MSNPEPFPKYLTPRTFPSLIWNLVQQAWGRKNVSFVEERPREKVLGPTICWKISRRLPGREGLERNKPRYRDSIAVDDQSQTERYAQWHTVWYQFDIYDVSDGDVNILIEEWEDLLFASNGLFKRFGIDEFIFDEEFEDEVMNKSQDVYVRSLRYRCIIERRYEKNIPLLQEILLRTFKERQKKIAVAVVRGTTDTDILPDKWIYSLNAVGKVPQTDIYDNSDYLNNIDFTTASENDGTAKLVWIPGRAAPTTGSTYYCSYLVFVPEPLKVLESGNP